MTKSYNNLSIYEKSIIDNFFINLTENNNFLDLNIKNYEDLQDFVDNLIINEGIETLLYEIIYNRSNCAKWLNFKDWGEFNIWISKLGFKWLDDITHYIYDEYKEIKDFQIAYMEYVKNVYGEDEE